MKNMRNLLFLLVLAVAFPFAALAQIKDFDAAVITINADCSSCGKTIEDAAYEKKVANAKWDPQTKQLRIVFNSKKTTLSEVLKRISYAGFDTPEFRAPNHAYDKLPECCKYRRTELVAVNANADSHAHHQQEAKTEVSEHKNHTSSGNETNSHANHTPHEKTPEKPAEKPVATPAQKADPHAGHNMPAKPTSKPATAKKPADANQKIATTKPAQTSDLLSTVYSNYFAVKDALVKNDSKSAAAKAAALQKSITTVPMDKMSTAQHDVWMKLYKALQTDAGKIAATTKLEQQRANFAALSGNMQQLVKAFNPNGTVYIQHCPMYNSNKGANWLSREKTIKNPYYGPAMLSCGSTVETIK